jgi:hypothetical protein
LNSKDKRSNQKEIVHLEKSSWPRVYQVNLYQTHLNSKTQRSNQKELSFNKRNLHNQECTKWKFIKHLWSPKTKEQPKRNKKRTSLSKEGKKHETPFPPRPILSSLFWTFEKNLDTSTKILQNFFELHLQ